MSDKQNFEKATGVVPALEEQSSQQPNFNQPIIIERKHSTGKGMAAGALVLSALAIGASGLLFVQGQNILENQKQSITTALDKAALGDSQNAIKLTESLDQQQKINAMVGELDVRQQKNMKHIADIQNAYRELLQGRVNWLVDEVEVTLNLASQQLLLSGNVPVAITVLESIEQRLSRFEQTELLPIKRAITNDLNVLKANAGSYTDISGTALKLDSLEKAIDGLPLIIDSALKAKATQQAEIPESSDFWVRTWDKTVHMLKSMVEVRHLESTDPMLLNPEQIYFVRANLRLRLLDARLALLQHNGEVYKNNLAIAESTVKQYFDVKEPTTKKWLEELTALNNKNLAIVSDDVLSGSRAAVRDYQNNVRTAVPVNLAPVEDLPAVSALNTNTASTASASAPAAKLAETQQISNVVASTPKVPEVKVENKDVPKVEEKSEPQKASEVEKPDTTKKLNGAAALLTSPATALTANMVNQAESTKTVESPVVAEANNSTEKEKAIVKKEVRKEKTRRSVEDRQDRHRHGRRESSAKSKTHSAGNAAE